MKNAITIKQSIYIARPPDRVWDFTQDYSKRPGWDKTILEATVVQESPEKVVKIRAKGGLTAHFHYKQFDRPNKSSLAMTDIRSVAVIGGGGSWKYEPEGPGTRWTQTNTLILKPGFWSRLIRPLVAYQLKQNTLLAMRQAKKWLE